LAKHEMSPTQVKKMLAKDATFQSNLKNCLDHLEKMPSLRAKIFNQVGEIADSYNRQKGHEGIIAGQQTRLALTQQRKDKEQAEKRNLDQLIKDTAEVSAL